MANPLLGRRCTPCRGGVSPLDEAAARRWLVDLPKWRLSDDARWISRDFRFKDFAGALSFVNQVGTIAETEGHHPDISLGWGYATTRLQTHKIGGLHENDFIMAAKIEALAAA